jgi:hypothetical protein
MALAVAAATVSCAVAAGVFVPSLGWSDGCITDVIAAMIVNVGGDGDGNSSSLGAGGISA